MKNLQAKRKRSKRYILADILDGLILATVIAGIVLFILYPICSVVSTSFFDDGKFTLQYYQEIFNPSNFQLVKNSLWVTTLSSVFTTFFAGCIALYAFASPGIRRKIVYNSLLITIISPPFVASLAFITLFGRRGLITHGLLGLSVNPYGWQGIVILQTIGNISFATLLLIASFDAIDLKQVLASRDLGASPFRTLLHIVFPAVKPGLWSVMFTLFTMNLADFGTPIVMGGRYKVLATEAYLQVLSSSSLGKPAAISMLMLPPAIIAFYFYRRTLDHAANLNDGSKSFSGSGYEFELPKWVRFALFAVILLFFAVMAMKYGNILLSSVSNTATGKVQFTGRYWKEMPRSWWGSFQNSLFFSVIAGFMASLMGILLSYYTHRRKLPGMKLMEFAASLPYIIPGTFFGLGYVAAFCHEPIMIRGTAMIIIINFTFRQISVANKSANAAFSSIDQKLESAARDLGASRLHILGGIILPLMKPVFFTSFISIFTSSMTAVGAIVFLISPGKNVASVELYNSIENGRYSVASVEAVLIILVTVTVNVISMSLMEHSRKRQKGEVRHVPTAK